MPFFVTAGVCALPQLLWLNSSSTKSSLTFHDGFLVENFSFRHAASYADFATYWWLNLGLAGPLVILTAIVCRKGDRKLLAATMAIFVFGNLVVFGVDVGGQGHKAFNLWEILINPFVHTGWFGSAARCGTVCRGERTG